MNRTSTQCSSDMEASPSKNNVAFCIGVIPDLVLLLINVILYLNSGVIKQKQANLGPSLGYTARNLKLMDPSNGRLYEHGIWYIYIMLSIKLETFFVPSICRFYLGHNDKYS